MEEASKHLETLFSSVFEVINSHIEKEKKKSLPSYIEMLLNAVHRCFDSTKSNVDFLIFGKGRILKMLTNYANFNSGQLEYSPPPPFSKCFVFILPLELIRVQNCFYFKTEKT